MIPAQRIPDDVVAICRRLREAGHQAHLVGGGVRDLLLGREPGDFDVATSAHPDEVMRLFGAAYAIPTGLKHGTVTVLAGAAPHRHVEVTTFRAEAEYLDARRPSQVRFGATLLEDLSRRDFTMNAIAFDPLEGELTDPFGGQADLARRTIRAVGDPLERFREDGLRPMRAVRQAAQLEFEIDERTRAAIPQRLDSFRKVSAERVRDELWKMLRAPRPSVGFELMRRTALLGEVLPELLPLVGCPQNRFHRWDVYEHTLATVDAARRDEVVRFGALLHDIGKPRTKAPRDGAPSEYTFHRHEVVGAEMAEEIARRLRLSGDDKTAVTALVAHHLFFYTPDWTDGAVRRFARRFSPELLDRLFALRRADIVGRGQGEDPDGETRDLEGRLRAVAAADAALHVRDLAIDGRDVMRLLGGRPGRQIGQVLERLLERVLDDPSLNTREALERLVSEVAAGEPPG